MKRFLLCFWTVLEGGNLKWVHVGLMTFCWSLCGLLMGADAAGQRVAPALTLGVEDGPPELVFGRIADATVDATGNVYILDSQFFQLRAFSAKGSFVASTGKRGEGPGEFIAPVSVAVSPSGSVFVLDQGANRIQRWALRKGVFQLAGSVKVPFFARRMCVLGQRIFVIGIYQNAFLHEMTFEAGVIRSFGVLPKAATPKLAELSSSDLLWCDAKENQLVTANSLYPDVFVYSESGTLKSHLRIRPFRQVVITTPGPGAVTYTMPKEGPNDLITGVLSHNKKIFVQVGYDAPGLDAVTNIRTYEVDVRGATLIRPSFPRLLKNVGAVVMGTKTDPFPSLTLYTIK